MKAGESWRSVSDSSIDVLDERPARSGAMSLTTCSTLYFSIVDLVSHDLTLHT
jgi:hypothetical protein